MTQESLHEHPLAWKKLLCQAFRDTTVPTSPVGRCNLLQIRQFVNQSLQHAGILNRSPFSIRQLIKIRIKSTGNPQQVKKKCIEAVLYMQKPSFCLLSSSFYIFLASVILSLITLLTPITATTFKSQHNRPSLLKITTIPWQDIEQDVMTLPESSDYVLAANPYRLTKQQQQLDKMNAAAWILEQNNSAYSLQLLSVADPSNVLEFCHQYGICDKTALYSTSKNGNKLTKLIYGSFANHQAAKIAKAKLSTRLKGVSPWARSFQQIKNEL